MIVWIIKTGEELPTDPGGARLLRSALLANELASRDENHVIFLSSTFNHQRKTMRAEAETTLEYRPGYQIVLLKGRAYSKNISIARFASQIDNAVGFLQWAAKQPVPDAIVTALPTIELAAAATWYAKRRNVPVIVDCRDMWPEVITEQLTGVKRIPGSALVFIYGIARKYALRNAAAVTGITQRFVDWGTSIAGRASDDRDRVIHLAIPPHQSFEPELIDKARSRWEGVFHDLSTDAVVGCFAGTLSKRLDLDTLLRAVALLEKRYSGKLKIVVCGKGDLAPEVEAACHTSRILHYAGWCTAVELRELMKRAQFGILPYPPSFDFSSSLPNKVGEYLSFGLPILTGLDGEIDQLLHDTDLKLDYVAGNPSSCSESISDFVDATVEGTRSADVSAKAARSLFEKRLHPDVIYPEFANFVEQVAVKK